MKLSNNFLLLALFAASGCASAPLLTEPSNDLERAISYREVARKEKKPIELSGTPKKGFGVPNGSEVDINSTIEIRVSTDSVQLPQPLGAKPTGYPASKAEKLNTALEKLSKVIESRTKRLEAYNKTNGIPLAELGNTPQFKEFIAAKKESGTLESEFLNLPIWTDGTFSINEKEVDKVFEDPTYKSVGEILQNELNIADAALRDTEEKLKKNAASLQLTAFLEPSKGDPTAIHLPNYDSLDQREAKFKESFMLDRDDWKTFEQQYRQTLDLAKEAEKVRNSESSLRDSIKKVGLSRLNNLIAAVDQLEPLLKEDWPALQQKIEDEVKFALVTAQEIAKKHSTSELALYSASAEQVQNAFKSSPPVTNLKEIVGQIRDLRLEWQNVSPESLPGTLLKTQDLAVKAPKTLSQTDFSKVEATLKFALETLESRPKEFPDEVWKELQDKLSQPGVLTRAKALVATISNLQALGSRIKEDLKFTEVSPSVTNLRLAEARDVPWADAPNTRIELQRTPRSIDDRVHVVATLKIGEADYMKSNATFSVKQFGWHSSLAPSVILDKPVKSRDSYDRDFKFAPSVAWLQTYYPRDTASGFWNSIMRVSQMGFGIHAAFLDHEQQKEGEIGIGATVSFWRDRIVVGYGWNLMSDSRRYVYIGSNLIPILQALGYGRDGGGGEKP